MYALGKILLQSSAEKEMKYVFLPFRKKLLALIKNCAKNLEIETIIYQFKKLENGLKCK